MKNFKYILLLATFVCNAVLAMERSGSSKSEESTEEQESKEVRIKINNLTDWDLKLTYGEVLYGEGKSYESIIRPHESVSKEENSELLGTVTVVPYGDTWKYTQFATPKDLSVDILKLAHDYPDNMVVIDVGPAKALSTWLSEKGALGSVASWATKRLEGFVSPFKFDIKSIPFERNEEVKFTIIRDAFPDVKAAILKGKPLLARYYLGLPAQANRASIDRAYLESQNKWKESAPNNKVVEVKLPIILRILELAHKALIAENELQEASTILLSEK